jgi:choline dehydrogenase-like flavoprotein
MEIDLAHLDSPHPDLFRAHICIIGAGIAGLTLAHKLTQLGADVLLLEAGGRTPDVSLPNEVIHRGQPHPGTTESRIRAFGGTSLTWGGQLLPLPADAHTWPITSAELAPFDKEAERLLGVDDLPYDAPSFFTRLQERTPDLLQQLPQLDPSLSKFVPFAHRNLAHTLGHKLRTHPKTRILLHAQATELLLTPTREAIEAVLVRTPASKTHRIEAAHFVLAAGTIETSRLLLASRSVAPEGVGNQNDQVGRNFHDHLTTTAATIRNPARNHILTTLRPWIFRGTLHSFKLVASPKLRAQLHLTPILAHLTFEEPDTSGTATLRSLLRARQQGHLSTTLRQSVPQLPQALRDAAHLLWSARINRRRYISPHAIVHLRLNAAQQTPSASRITLSPDLKPILDWRIHPNELATLRTFAAHLRTSLDRANLTTFDWNSSLFEPAPDAPLVGLDDARHAMGGASMGTDPHTSVVTPDLRVHGLRNLFVASAATFPNGTPQLPTLPLMSLSLRLAEHLNHCTESQKKLRA